MELMVGEQFIVPSKDERSNVLAFSFEEDMAVL
jgi:hypothetical protein